MKFCNNNGIIEGDGLGISICTSNLLHIAGSNNCSWFVTPIVNPISSLESRHCNKVLTMRLTSPTS